MKKKILVFFMIFILLFVFTNNIFASSKGFDNPFTIINNTDFSILYSTSVSFSNYSTILPNSSSVLYGSSSSPRVFKLSYFNVYTFILNFVYYDVFNTSNINFGYYDGSYHYFNDIVFSLIDNRTISFSYDLSSFNPDTIFVLTFSSSNLYIGSIEFYTFNPPFYQPFLDFNSQLIQNTWSFIPDLFSDTYLNFTIFIAGIFSILFMIFIITYMIKKFTRGT